MGFLLSFSNLSSQEKITKKYTTSGVDAIKIEVKFAENITIKNWNKKEVLVEAEVNINENKDNSYFTLTNTTEDKVLRIESDYGELFEKYKKEEKEKKQGKHTYYGCHNNLVVNYIVYVPKGMQLKVKSISGSVALENYEGKLTLDLISGDIEVKAHSKDMNLKTISGDIDIYVKDAQFRAETLTGTVYSDLDIDFGKRAKYTSEYKVKGTVRDGNASLKMKTISGNIFLRKI